MSFSGLFWWQLAQTAEVQFLAWWTGSEHQWREQWNILQVAAAQKAAWAGGCCHKSTNPRRPLTNSTWDMCLLFVPPASVECLFAFWIASKRFFTLLSMPWKANVLTWVQEQTHFIMEYAWKKTWTALCSTASPVSNNCRWWVWRGRLSIHPPVICMFWFWPPAVSKQNGLVWCQICQSQKKSLY